MATILTLALLVVGTVTVPYLSTLIEGKDTSQTRPAVKLADLQIGSFVEVKLPTSRVFVLRDFDSQIHVFTVPHDNIAYWLPEFDWSHPAIPCAEFGPDNRAGMLIKDGAFRCRRPDQGEFLRYEHSWSYSGRNLGYRTADMKVADYELRDGAIYLSHLR